MAVLGSTLLSLCFGMLLLSASSADYPDRCMSFSTVHPTTGPGIKISSNIYESNRIYTISVPVDSSTNSVVLRAMDTNNNSSVGLWQTADGLWKIADPVCNGSVLYQRPDTREGFFRVNWQSPHFTNITVEIHNDHNITLHDLHDFQDLHDLHDFQDLHDLHDQADHNPKPNDKPIPNHSQNRNLNSNHNQKLRQQNLPQPHHRCHPDPARLPHQQTPLLKAVPASATSSCAQFQARALSCV
ncbi:PREDICTED: placenta-expressed transcript 1 protein isoform X1 [Myotis davidii]|uniref:placenta-expressed transcript 1 protein isoform X1 n=1 Tax=Myotis davidii TaxID=225400 RepID=UPI0007670F47|nr:PREDICTED: placenta-expressed transcript 1 protein isoform X1 [Myotis davidii]